MISVWNNKYVLFIQVVEKLLGGGVNKKLTYVYAVGSGLKMSFAVFGLMDHLNNSNKVK